MLKSAPGMPNGAEMGALPRLVAEHPGASATMIVFTRLNRTEIGLNPDQIQRVEATPDTVITLNDEKRFLVLESVDEVVRRIMEYRALVLALANTIDVSNEPRPALHLVPGDADRARNHDDH